MRKVVSYVHRHLAQRPDGTSSTRGGALPHELGTRPPQGLSPPAVNERATSPVTPSRTHEDQAAHSAHTTMPAFSDASWLR
jgi:hypothetical protein